MSWYKKIDKKLGGWLPGGVSRKPTPKAPAPKEAGRLIVTPKEAESIPPSSKTPIKVVSSPSASPAGSLSRSSSGGRSSSSSLGSSSRSSSLGTTGPVDVGTGQVIQTEETKSSTPTPSSTASTSVTQVEDTKPSTTSSLIQDPTKLRFISTPEITRAEPARDVKFSKQGFWDSVRFGSFKYFGDVKRDTPVPGEIKSGTLSTDPMTGQLESPFVTYGQREREISKPFEIEQLTTRIGAQARVDAGEDIDKVTEEYRARSSSISKEQQKALSSAGVIDLYSRPAQEDLQKAGQVAKIGATVGAFAISPVLGAGVLTAEGVWKTTKRADTGDAFRETLFAGRADLMDEKDRTFFSPMEQQFKATRTEGGIALLGGAVGFAQVPGQIGRSITLGRFQEGIASPTITRTTPLRFTDGRAGGVSITTPAKQVYGFDSFQKVAFGVQPTETGLQFATGTGKQTIRVLDFMREGTGAYPWTSTTTPFSFGATFTPGKPLTIGTDALRVGLPEGTTAQVLRGGYVVRGDSISPILPRGTVQMPVGDAVATRGGIITAIKPGTTTARFTAKDFGIVKPGFTTPSPATTTFGARTGGGPSTPFSLTFQQQMPVQDLGAGLGAGLAGPTTRFTPATPRLVPGFSPSIFAGTGQYELTQTSQFSPLTPPQITAQPTFDTRQDTFTGTGLITSTRTGTTSKKGTSTIAPPITTPITSPIQDKIITPITRLKPVASPSLISPGVGFGMGPPGLSPFKPFPPFKFPRPFGADAGGGLGKIRATRRFRYTPSFGALALKGQAFKLGGFSTKRFTGLEFRGATPKTTTTKKKKKKTKK